MNKHASHEAVKKEMMGHNRLQLNPEIQAKFKELHKLSDSKKAITQTQRDIVAELKEKHGLPGNVVRRELALERMDEAARSQLEEGLKDIKVLLGIDLAKEVAGMDVVGKKLDPMEAAKAEKSATVKAVK